MRATGLFLLSITPLLACDTALTAPERDDEAPVQTEHLRYQLTRDVWPLPDGPVVHLHSSIGYRYRNPTDRTIYVVKCSSVSFQLQKLDDEGEWTDIWAGSDYERCLGPPTVIPAREEISGTLKVGGFEPNRQAWPQFATADLQGVYRMVLLNAVYLDDPADYPDGTPVEIDYLYSNQFALEVG